MMMFIRTIISFAMPMAGSLDNRLTQFIYTTTEIAVLPTRSLFEHFSWFKNSFLDVPFFVTFILLEFIKYWLSCIA